MPAIVTNKFRLHNAKQFREAFLEDEGFTSFANTVAGDTSLDTNMYLFIGRVSPWADDTEPPSPIDNFANTEYDHWRDMIAAKKIIYSDVAHCVPRYNWTNNTPYFAYTHASNTIFDESFYVLTDDFNVYKCVANNNGQGNSTGKPTGTSATVLNQPADDGYLWKYMYTISAAKALKFVTPNYIPVQQVRWANSTMVTSENVSQENEKQRAVETSAVDGALQVIHKTANGSGYLFRANTLQTSTNTTVFSLDTGASAIDDIYIGSDIYFLNGDVQSQGGTITDYVGSSRTVTINTALSQAPAGTEQYSLAPKVTISGDGQGCNARAQGSDSDGLTNVYVVAAGNSYSTATATITANSSHGSSATALPIIEPVGGHGYDAVDELGGYFVMLNSRLEYSESDNFTTENDFRKIGLLAQPRFANGNLATATVVDQAIAVTLQTVTGTFPEDAVVTGAQSGATGIVIDANSTVLRMADVTKGSNTTNGFDGTAGSFQNNESLLISSVAQANSTAITGGDLQKYSGDILYVEHRSPVTRSNDQIEDIKLIIEF